MKGKKLVQFGAGKIGRSFIGQLFSRSGYEVVLIDIKPELIKNLNRLRTYKVIIKSSEGDEILNITNVRGVNFLDTDRVVDELAGADIAALSVGQQGLPATIPLIAGALLKRRQLFGDWPLDIIIAENMRNADRFLLQELSQFITVDYPFDRLLGLVETSIGKMVPIMSQKDIDEDPLQVFAEPYNTLIVAKNSFKNPVPDILDLAPKENIKAWVDQKFFIHNLGHATAAYLGYRKDPGAKYIWEILEIQDIYQKTRATMQQSASILMALYPGEFTPAQIEEHIDNLLVRFRNKELGDTLFRVGSDLLRKLSPDDRLAGPIHAAIRLNKPYGLILDAIKAAIQFRATDENGSFFPGDEKFFHETEKGFAFILKEVCKLG